jgi:hypothetical protein
VAEALEFMGHVRLGRLPNTLPWRGVVALIDETPDDVPAVARGTALAAEQRLRTLARDPSLTHCFWVLTRVATASRHDDFATQLVQLGLPRPITGSALGYIAQVTDQVRSDLSTYTDSGPSGELASLALRRTLSETVGVHGRSLFGSSVDDIQRAFIEHSSPTRFGELARRFFGDYLARTLRFLVEKEVSNHVGAGHGLTTIEASSAFATSLDLYARQSARIVEDFAAGWYGKHNWESADTISAAEAQGFVAIALRKLRMELARTDQ